MLVRVLARKVRACSCVSACVCTCACMCACVVCASSDILAIKGFC